MRAYDDLIKENGGKVVGNKRDRGLAQDVRRLWMLLKLLRIDWRTLSTITSAVFVGYLLALIVPHMYDTRAFGVLSDIFGSTAVFVAIFPLIYVGWKASTTTGGVYLLIPFLLHTIGWAVLVSVLVLSSNALIADGTLYFNSEPLYNYGGGVIGDQIALFLVESSLSLFGAVHPSIVVPTGIIILTSILLGNYFSRLAIIVHYLLPTVKEEQTKIKMPAKKKTAAPIETTGLEEVLGLHGFKGVKLKGEALQGASITRYKVILPKGSKTSKLVNAADDISRDLKVNKIVIDPIGDADGSINIEVENKKRDFVYLRNLLNSDAYQNAPGKLNVILGEEAATGQVQVADLSKMPHLLIAGTTGAGKSVALNALLISMLYNVSPEDVKLILIDPKMLELGPYQNMPHLLFPVMTQMKEVAGVLHRAVAEMEYRYHLMEKAGVRNIDQLNKKLAKTSIPNPLYHYQFGAGQHDNDAFKHVPFSVDAEDYGRSINKLSNIVIVADEFADMMMVAGKEVEKLIARLAQKARAAGIHLILATQRPSVDVITGLIKANITTRLAFMVGSGVDSRTILDRSDAKRLLGLGDGYFQSPKNGDKLVRIQSPFVEDEEVEEFVRTGSLKG